MANIPSMPRRPSLGPVLLAAAVGIFFGGGIYLSIQAGGSLGANLGTLPPVWLMALALVGGTASFFSPCGLALTPAFLGYLIMGRGGASQDPRARRALNRGSRWLAAGIVSFYLVVGLAVAVVGSVLFRELVYLNLLVGVVLLGLGPAILTGRGLGGLQARLARVGIGGPRSAPPGARALYRMGWLYGVASQSCAVPIFLGIVVVPLSTGVYWLGAAATVLYGGAIAVLLVVVVAMGGQTLMGRWQARWGPWLQRATGILFALTGALLLAYAAQALGAL